MKRITAMLLALLLVLPAAAAEIPDISGLTFDELVALRNQIDLAIWNSKEWQEVTVPAGVWVVGEDIPAGHWTIRAIPGSYTSVVYCDKLDEFGTNPDVGWRGWNGTLSGHEPVGIYADERTRIDLDMVEGMYFINRTPVIFTPFAGKPDLGFK